MAEAEPAGEPSLDPAYLLRAVRAFLAVAAEPHSEPGSQKPLQPEAQDAADDEPLGWEEAGCLVWDVAALPDDAAFLVQHGLPAMLPPLLAATAAAERWRPLEIGLGVLGNLACHAAVKPQLLQQRQLAELLLDTALWVDDAASLAELCRCLASLLADSNPQGAQAWWALLLREETLGRLAWIVENTLSSALLERTLNLLGVLVTAAAAAAGDAQAQLVPQLLALDLLPLLASVLHGWVVRLRAEQQLFAGGSGGAAADEAATAAQQAEAAPAEAAAAAAGDDDPPAASIVPPAPGSPAQWDEKAVAAAEVTEEAALEALGLLEVLAADAAGEPALNAAVPVKEALLRTIAESENRAMRALSTALLAGLEGVGPLLLQHPAAVAAVLARLRVAAATAAAEQGAEAPAAKRARGGAPEPAMTPRAAAQQAAEEVEASWALCSALAHALASQPEAAEEQEAVEAAAGAADAAAALGVLAEHADVLCHDWAASGPSLGKHQAYVLARVARQLAPLLDEAGAARLQAAAVRGGTATEKTAQE